MPQLVLPHPRYRDSFLEALHEYHGEKLPTYEPLDELWLSEHFDEYVGQLHRESRGQDLPIGYEPHTVFWLVEGNRYLGRLDIRHQLNEWLSTVGGHIGYDIRPTERGKGLGKLQLELGLQKARELGFEKVLITCDVDNVPSNTVIKANGGVLESTHPVAPGKPDKNRYWITLQDE